MRRNSPGEKKPEWGSSVRSMPSIDEYTSASVPHVVPFGQGLSIGST
jgi:hypothetical protein